MDIIKKLVSGRLPAGGSATGGHLDADALSAFAENAVSAGDRQVIVAHLEQCDSCREILFLALPEHAESQRVLSLAPRRSRFAFRWGTAAAMLTIAAVVLVSTRYKQPQASLSAGKQTPPAPPPPAQLAKETRPPELDQMRASRDKMSANKAVDESRGFTEKKVVPSPKHATGTLQAPVVFDSSDQAVVGGMSKAINVPEVEMPPQKQAALPPAAAAPAAATNGWVAAQRQEKQKDQSEVANAFGVVHGQAVGGPIGAGSGLAVGQFNRGHLSGSITDASGATISNAVVTTSGPFGTQTVLSDALGKFSFDDLTAGNYSVTAQATGFRSSELPQVAVADNKFADVRLTLQPGATSETVEVTSQAVMPMTNSSQELEVASNSVKAKSRDNSARSATLKAAQAGALAKSFAIPILQWTLSPEGHVERSLDLGRTWQVVAVPGGDLFRALSSVGTQVWAGGKKGLLFHSPDSGRSWNRVTPATATQALSSDIVRVDFSDAANGTLRTSDGQIWSTGDAGQTWQKR